MYRFNNKYRKARPFFFLSPDALHFTCRLEQVLFYCRWQRNFLLECITPLTKFSATFFFFFLQCAKM